MKRDAIIIIGMVLTVGGTLFACVRSRLFFTRIGFVISAVAVCVGLAYFGLSPLFGGSHSPATFFGCAILFVGLLGFCLFGSIEEILDLLTDKPAPGNGFPVVQSQAQSEEPGKPVS